MYIFFIVMYIHTNKFSLNLPNIHRNIEILGYVEINFPKKCINMKV